MKYPKKIFTENGKKFLKEELNNKNIECYLNILLTIEEEGSAQFSYHLLGKKELRGGRRRL